MQTIYQGGGSIPVRFRIASVLLSSVCCDSTEFDSLIALRTLLMYSPATSYEHATIKLLLTGIFISICLSIAFNLTTSTFELSRQTTICRLAVTLSSPQLITILRLLHVTREPE
ncbi:hypothetical protein EG68_06379 [Paragonimus skrjabini miyazakii]|uniref:Uncharacterized protein n=1 Tax=Paragonimus skrjabini miyazakii TaxID=59628 RepID=A0A8S9YRB4_9TREM|nr:hypothetical protein EG68_06379 [Paragonimus skrjabini miyazakii]